MTHDYTTYYDNKSFTLSAGYTNGVLGIDVSRKYYSAHAVVYDNNTLGWDSPGVLGESKALRRAINSVVERLTGKPALMNINILNELKTYKEFYSL